ncbi:hypothetical protein FRX31_005784 [Thalictrum thalictroides]|uniref:Uncharacterized protein n=1 Tax=Thalictrum thalictroides TaxID=46969 RepID=A0A7J6X4H8_THATH|nr:hypothetical protein FRX31_005784 [Thalictrum thalictroides]
MFGLHGRYQFRRLEFASEKATEVYTKLSLSPSTQALEVDVLKLLRISHVVTEVTDEEEERKAKRPKTEREEIFVMKASQEILSNIASDPNRFQDLLPPEEEEGDAV